MCNIEANQLLGRMSAFLYDASDVKFQSISNDAQRYGFIAAVLKRFAYRRLVRADKGVVLRYLESSTDCSRQQLTRPVRRFLDCAILAKRYRISRRRWQITGDGHSHRL